LGRLFFVALAVAALSLQAGAFADTPATVDLNHTAAHFAAKHLLLSTVQGSIPLKEARATLGSGGMPISVEALFDITKLDTHNERRDNDLRSERFLDAAKFPEMSFKSTKVTPGSGGSFTMAGMLTIKGTSLPVTLNGNMEGNVKDNQGRTHYGYAASLTIDRTKWGVGANIPAAVVSTEVAITIEAETIVASGA
jgi:polyisoprenoid-binding protein YceI